MSFGKMNQPIQIAKAIVSADTYGFNTVTDNILAETRAYVEYQRGTARWANLSAFSTATVMFRFRYIPDLMITPSMVILFDGKRYRITSAEDVRNKHMYIEIYAEIWEPKAG